jgi:hypothetical protein
MGMADIGFLTRIDFLKPYSSREKNTSFGLVLKNLGPPAKGDPLPTVMTAGISYKPLRPLMLAFDFNVPMNLHEVKLSEKPYWSTGFAVQATSFLSMRMGLMAKKGNVRVTVGSAIMLKKIAMDINYSLDLLTQLQPMNRVSVGVRFDLGDQGRKVRDQKVDELYLAGLDAYSQGDYDHARTHWADALALNPRFDPAKEGLNIIEHTIGVQQRIEDMQRLNF